MRTLLLVIACVAAPVAVALVGGFLFWLGDLVLRKFGGEWGKNLAAKHAAQDRMDDQAGRPLF